MKNREIVTYLNDGSCKMKAKNHFYILICLLSLRGFSQDRGADSLKKLLAATQNDSVRVKRLLELSSYYLNSSTELAKRYAQQALELSHQQLRI